MLSWHKPGQKVTPIDDEPWDFVKLTIRARIRRWWLGKKCGGPAFGEVCTIKYVRVEGVRVLLHIAEHRPNEGGFDAKDFRPVYPQAIDALRRLDVPVMEREDA